MMKRIINKQLPLLLAAAVCAGCAGTAGSAAPAAPGNGRLVSTVTKYTKDFESKEWVVSQEIEYQYENRYPVSMKRAEYGSDDPTEFTYSYTFENGLPVSMELHDPQSGQTTRTEYNEGRVWRVESSDPERIFTSEKLFQYGIGGPFFTDVLHVNRENSSGEGVLGATMEEIDAARYTSMINYFLLDGGQTFYIYNWY